MLVVFNSFRKSSWPYLLLTVYGLVLMGMGASEVASTDVDWIDTNLFTGLVLVAIFGGRLALKYTQSKREEDG